MDILLYILYAGALIVILIGLLALIRKVQKAKKKLSYPGVVTGDQKIFSPKPARYEYVFSNGIKAFMEELTGDQDIQLAELFTDMDLQSFEKMNIKTDLLKALKDHNAVEKFFNIIMHVQRIPAGASFTGLRNSEYEKIFTDFFFLNPFAKKALQLLNTASVFMNTARTPKEQPIKQDTGIPN